MDLIFGYLSGGYNSDCVSISACLEGGEAGGVSGFSAGEGPGGQTGKCLFGMGIGHTADVLMLSKFKDVVSDGSGEEERWGDIGRGRATAAILCAGADDYG